MKTQQQENFPVASRIFSKKLRKIITDYYNFARYCDDIADNPKLSEKQKLEKLGDIELSLFNKKKNKQANALHDDFIKEKLDFSLATDLLVAFRQDACKTDYETWSQLLDYCKYSAVPVGRFMLAIHDENPSTYLPASALCIVLQITNHIQDLKSDVKKLKRIYLPKELLRQYNVSKHALTASKCSKNLHFLLNDILDRCCGLLKDAEILPAIVKNIRLRIYICVTIVLSEILINKLYNADILDKKICLSKTDWFIAFVKGIWKGLFVKRKTLTNKGF